MRFASIICLVYASLLMAGCQSSPEAIARRTEMSVSKAEQWGDRTVAILYRFTDPIVGYFGPANGNGGEITVWDGGRSDLVKGRWYVRDGVTLCVKPNVYYKEMIRGTLDSEFCGEFGQNPLQFSHYQGDVFQLAGRDVAPYVSSKADIGQIRDVLRRSKEFGVGFWRGEETLKEPRYP